MDTLKKLIKGAYYGYMSMVGCGCTVLMLLFVIPFFFGIFGALAGVKSAGNAARIPMPFHGGMVVVDLSSPIVEAPTSHDKFMNYLNGTYGNISIYDLSRKIKSAAEDKQVSGIVICGSMADGSASFSQASELRSLLQDFKASGKPVYAYLENPTQGDYYVASVAEKIYANPAGTIEFKGLSLKSLFLGNALKKYGIDVELVRAGKYKSAGETFTSDKMSPESREAYGMIADGVWNNLLASVSASRGISVSDLQSIAFNKAVLNAEDARKLRLVDVVCPRDYFVDDMTKVAGAADGTFRQISLQHYSQAPFKAGRRLADAIAVLYLDGQIVEGDVRAKGYITSGYYASIIRDLRNDRNVRGVVLRINSPGGSAYASEILRREIELLANEKPVVASYSSTAASGAYWISAGANKIVAQENTLTGSIGVFGMILSGEKLASNFGVTFDSVETSPLADIMSGTRPMTAQERDIIQNLIDKTYSDFLKIVSKGRKMPVEDVDKIAQGRVWLASNSKHTKLFDEFGGLDKAIGICEELAEAGGKLQVRQYPGPETFRDLFTEAQSAPFAKLQKLFMPEPVSQTLRQLEFKSPIRAQSDHILTIED